jgi:alpha-tubulin suppressor-like RCC1 family protein
MGAGWYHSLAILGDGTLWTWGFNEKGQLGNGSPTGSGAINATPTRVTGWVSQD